MHKKYVRCKKCGIVDTGKTGTSITMICKDCNQGKLNKYGRPLAELCRKCCPSHHGTTSQRI